MPRSIRDNSLSLVLLGMFLAALVGQSVTGWRSYNDDQQDHNQPEVGYGSYLTSGHFIESVFENWESEYLQDGLYVFLTVFLYQRGSAESKDPDKEEAVDADPRESQNDPNAPWPVRQGGLPLTLYKHSLVIIFALLFMVSLVLHAFGGAEEYSNEQLQHGGAAVSLLQYMGTARFWFESFQNWQSEFLALLSIVVFSIVLRQQGSPESKPVAEPHSKTGSA
jgi:hypothetical protein